MKNTISPDVSIVGISQVFRSISTFAACLRGVEAIEVGINRLAASVGAQSVLLSRLSEGKQRPAVVAVSALKKTNLVALNKPFCDNVLEINPWSLQVGACVYRSGLDHPSASSRNILERWERVSGTRDIVVMVVEVKKAHVDRIEMHFDRLLDRNTINLCEEIGKALPLFYETRAPEIIEDAILRSRKNAIYPSGKSVLPILSDSNPFRLTRSEFRLCHVVSRGLSYKALPTKLGISSHTVRTHLRNIYPKLEVNDFYELSHRLVSINERVACSRPNSIAS